MSAAPFKLLDVLRTRQALPNPGGSAKVPAGSTGTVVMVYREPLAYEVEFADQEGRTIALLTLTDEQLQAAAEPA